MARNDVAGGSLGATRRFGWLPMLPVLTAIFILLPQRSLEHGGSGNDYGRYLEALIAIQETDGNQFGFSFLERVAAIAYAHTSSVEPLFWIPLASLAILGVALPYIVPLSFGLHAMALFFVGKGRTRAFGYAFPICLAVGSLLFANLTANYIRQGFSTLYFIALVVYLIEGDGRIQLKGFGLATLAVLCHFSAAIPISLLMLFASLRGRSPLRSKRALTSVVIAATLGLVVVGFIDFEAALYKFNVYLTANEEMESNNATLFYAVLLVLLGVARRTRLIIFRDASLSSVLFRFHLALLAICVVSTYLQSSAATRLPIWGIVVAYIQMFPQLNLARTPTKVALLIVAAILFYVVHYHRIPGFFNI